MPYFTPFLGWVPVNTEQMRKKIHKSIHFWFVILSIENSGSFSVLIVDLMTRALPPVRLITAASFVGSNPAY